MQRILHVNDYPPETGGGAEVVMGRTMELLRQRGLNVESFTVADVPHACRTPWAYIHNAAACASLAAKLAAFQPDVVHLHNFYHALSPAILATLADRKRTHSLRVVMTAHDYHLACPNSGGNWFPRGARRPEAIDAGGVSLATLLTRRWDQRSFAHSWLKLAQHWWNYRWQRGHDVIDLVICPSRFVARMLEPAGLTCCVLPHPVPNLPAVTACRPERLSVAFAGRLEPEKGLLEFLERLPADFPASLTIIGAGSERARCEEACRRRGLGARTQFLGRLSHAETLARIAGSHLLVQPSIMLESYGLTLIEALAVGTNVLATNRGASPELVNDAGAGFLFDVDRPASMMHALGAVLDRHAAGTLNRFDVSDFLKMRGEQAHIDRLLHWYGGNVSILPLAA